MFGAAPRDDPLTYPGAVPPFSFLFTGDGVEAVAEGADALDQVGEGLARLGAVGLDRRHVVVAYGSNRSPAQLRAKFAGSGVAPVVPVLRARVHGLAVVHACHVARYGSIPATVVAVPEVVSEVAVTYLDDDQCELIDATEPVHERPVVDGDLHPLRLLGGTPVASYRCYRSTRAVLTLDGRPIRVAEVAGSGGDLPVRDQLAMQDLLLGLWRRRAVGRFADPAAFVAAVRTDPDVRREVDRCLAGLAGRPDSAVGAVAPVPFGYVVDDAPRADP